MGSIEHAMRMKELVDSFIHKYGRLPTERDPDYLEMLRMTKYTVEDVPYFKPGHCANCGSSKNDGRKYINIGLDLEWYGIVYFCTTCLKDIAKFAGLFDEYENTINQLVLEVGALKLKLDQGVKLPDKLVQAWEEFKEYYVGQLPSESNSPPDTVLSTDGVPPIQESNETESDKLGTVAAKQRATKSTASSGRKNVPSLAELLNKPDD